MDSKSWWLVSSALSMVFVYVAFMIFAELQILMNIEPTSAGLVEMHGTLAAFPVMPILFALIAIAAFLLIFAFAAGFKAAG